MNNILWMSESSSSAPFLVKWLLFIAALAPCRPVAGLFVLFGGNLSNVLFLWYFFFTLSAALVVPIWSISPSSNIKDPSYGTDSVRNFRLFPNSTESCLNTSISVQWWTRSEISLHWVRIESFPLLMADWLSSWNCTLVFEGQSTLFTSPALSSICTEKSLELLKWPISKLINGLFL